MSERDRGDRGALVALALLLAAIVLVGLITAWVRQPANSENGQPYRQGEDCHCEQQPPPTLNAWPQFTPSDTYAQWIVAALSLIGTGVSIWAVVLVCNTLALNRQAVAAAEHGNRQSARAALAAHHASDAAIEANQIARAGHRAWLGIVTLHRPTDANCTEEIAPMSVSLTVRNYGDTSALPNVNNWRADPNVPIVIHDQGNHAPDLVT